MKLRKSMQAQPRVLILSEEIPQTIHAGGIILHRLFAAYGEKPEIEERRSELGERKPVAVVEGGEPAKPAGDGRLEIGEGGAAGPAGDGRWEIGDGSRTSSSELRSSTSPSAKLFVIGPRAHPDAERLDCPYRELRMPLQRLEKTRFNRLKRSLQAIGLIPLPSRSQVLRLLGDFRPEIVVSVMQGTPFISVAARIARAFGVPLVLIVHDLNEEFERVYPWAKKALFRWNRSVYREAAWRLCVSPEMAEYLEGRYGVPGEVMYPNRSEELQPRPLAMSLSLRAAADQETKRRKDEREEWQEEGEDKFDKGKFGILKDTLPATSDPLQASAPLTLGYAGSLAYGYGEELVRLIDVFRQTGTRIRLFSPRPAGRLAALDEAHDVVEICGYRPALEAWREIQETCDAVTLPYANPAGDQELLYRTHFPSKLTEYLALGMPVIVSGPEMATGVRYANAEKLKNGKAENLKFQAADFQRLPKGRLAKPRLSISEFLDFAPNGAIPCTTREELVGCLLRLKEDGELRRELAERAVEAGQRDFDPVAIRERFWEVLGGERRSHEQNLKT